MQGERYMKDAIHSNGDVHCFLRRPKTHMRLRMHYSLVASSSSSPSSSSSSSSVYVCYLAVHVFSNDCRPTRFIVMRDDVGFTSDQIQNLSNRITWLH